MTTEFDFKRAMEIYDGIAERRGHEYAARIKAISTIQWCAAVVSSTTNENEEDLGVHIQEACARLYQSLAIDPDDIAPIFKALGLKVERK